MGWNRPLVLRLDPQPRLPDGPGSHRRDCCSHSLRKPSCRSFVCRGRSPHSAPGAQSVRRLDTVTAATWRRFCRSKLAVGALLYIATVALIALLAPLIATDRPTAPVPFGPNTVDIARRLQPPDDQHRLGTDDLG